MPCYSYTTNSSISAGNIEIVYAASGNTYSYSNLFWVCEFPVENQILVYTRPNSTGTETLKVLGTDYTLSGTNIVFTSTPTGEVVIRRATPSNKMLFVFNDGAKLTAEQLNGAFHQLLFAIQEKDLVNSTTNYIYTISSTVAAWSGATAYVVGNLVSFSNSIYRCILGNTNQTPPNATYWNLVNPSQAGFVLSGNNSPISVNVANLSPGKALVWNGTEFRADTFTGLLNDLTDVTLTSPALNQLLRYNGSQWVNITPSFDITSNNPVLADRAFYNSAITTSYTNNNSSIAAPALLARFKNNSNQWVLTDPPTVYHIINELTPGSTAAETWFSNIDSTVSNLSQTLTNPVKAKLYWNLRTHKSNFADSSNGDTLDNYKTLFYDSPEELYSIVGYDTADPSPIRYHGVSVTGGTIHKDNPYYYSNNANPAVFKSKIEGYGIKNFYLSVPECRSSNFLGIQIRSGGSYITPLASDIQDGCNANGDETANQYRDYYLQGLRELAFAANLNSTVGLSSSAANVKDKMLFSRYMKRNLLRVNYKWNAANTTTVDFKRLESSNTSALVLWKIPKQIIYYNKAAMALANNTATRIQFNGEIDNTYKNRTRFDGQSRFHPAIGTFTNSTITTLGAGTLFKADAYWADWVNKWSTDAGNNENDYQFMESDIEWMAAGVTDTSSNPSLFDYYSFNPPRYNSTNGYSNGLIYPWTFRSLEPRLTSTGGFNDYIGHLLHNIDSNTLFSKANSFIPDPIDEYVYRVVLNKNLTPVFKETGITTLKSSIILEYGFSESTYNRLAGSTLTNENDIFLNPTMPAANYRALSRLKETDIHVYVKSENIESIGGIERVVITLGIKVPRLKSIGYSRVFRRKDTTTANYPQRGTTNNSAAQDTEIDGGPWNFSLYANSPVFSNAAVGSLPALTAFTLFSTPYNSLYNERSSTSNINSFNSFPSQDFISGRNESAVKFTRLGIPSTLWIRLSVLNTNASYDLINTSGFINTEPV